MKKANLNGNMYNKLSKEELQNLDAESIKKKQDEEVARAKKESETKVSEKLVVNQKYAPSFPVPMVGRRRGTGHSLGYRSAMSV